MEGEKDSDAVWNELMACGDSLEQSTADPSDNGNKDEDVAMRILDEQDEEDVDEIQILTPLPPPAEHHTPAYEDPKQVNNNSEKIPITCNLTDIDTNSADPHINLNSSLKGSDVSGSTGQTGADPGPDPGLAPPVHTVPDPDSMENVDGKSSNCSEVTYQSVNTSYSKHGIKIKGESYGEDETTFTEPEKPYMPSTYYQNKSARAALQSHTVKCVDFGEESGATKTVSFTSVSSLDCMGDTEVLKTFRGTRANSSGGAAHQSISFSFDPATLTCISCNAPHKIFDVGKKDSGASTIIFCDQNFVPTLYGGCSCVAIARLEDGSLAEIADLALEVLERQSIPPGTLLLIGSVSHLQHVGTTIFAQDWCKIVQLISEKLRNVKVIPCIPILREDGPGSLGGQLIEISHWFETVYDKNTLGCTPAWSKLVEIIGNTDEDGLDLGFTDFYTVALPQTLDTNSDLTPVKFCHSSSHTTVRGIDSVTSDELLRTLLNLLQSNFASVANSDEILSREPATQDKSDKEFTHCIIAGGSNMKRLCPHLTNLGITVLDLTKKGWTPTEANIRALANEIREIPDTRNIPVIMDLLGNFAFRYEQSDGTQALPFKMGGRYHFDGKVNVCSHTLIRSAISSLKPVFDAIKGPALFCSPHPHCLYNGCCLEDGHCPGVDTSPYVSLCWTTLLRCAPFAKLRSRIWVKLKCGSQMSSGKCSQPVPILRNWPQVSNTYFLLMVSILPNRVMKKWPTSLRKALQRSYQKTTVLLPSLFQVHQPVPAARNRETSIGEVLCHLLAAPDRKIRTLPTFPPIKGLAKKWKGHPVNVGRGASRGRGDPSRGGSLPRGPRGNPRMLPYYRRN